MTSEQTFRVVDGPSRWKLAVATYEPHATVTFTVLLNKRRIKFVATITGVNLRNYPNSRNIFLIQAQASKVPQLTNGVNSVFNFEIEEYSIPKHTGKLTITLIM